MNINKLIVGFNKKDEPTLKKIKVLFRSILVFVRYIIKIGRVEELNLNSLSGTNYSYYDHRLYSTLYYEILESTGPNYFLKYFSGISKEDDGYYYSGTFFDTVLSSFFEDYEQSRAVEQSLSRDWVNRFEIYSDNIDYFYEIVKDLNKTNKKYLKDKILYYCGTDKFHKTDFNWYDPYEGYFDEEGWFSVYENIDEIMRYDGLFDMVINDLNVLSDLKVNLTQLYNTAYNETWGDEMRKIVFLNFNTYFDMDTLVEDGYKFKVKIKNFDKIISKYFKCGNNESGLHITYDEMLYSLFYETNCLTPPSFEILSIPQKSKVSDFMNEQFIDYVY